MPLTHTGCKNARPAAKPYKLTDGGGLYLLVMPTGAKYWRLKYRHLAKEKHLALGVYPVTSLADAREARDTAKKQLAGGIDPGFAKKEDKRRARLGAENSFEVMAREWHENRRDGWSPRHADYILHRLELDVFPRIGPRPVADISAPELLDVIREIERRGALEIAKRALQVCGQVFRYSIATGRAMRNPAADLKGALKPSKPTHYAAIEARELPDLLRAMQANDARLYPQTRLAMRLLLLTFVRTSELINAVWSEFDLDEAEWLIPAGRMKMRSAHIVPLSKQALVLLKEQKMLTGRWEFVFPNLQNPKKPMSNATILRGLERMGYKGRMTGHGFRALAMTTIKEKLGYRHEVIDRQLAHAPRSKVDAAYDRAMFLSERRKMMQQWADYVDTLANGPRAKPAATKN